MENSPVSGRTLEAWVQVDGLDQRGGGVISIQSADGARFDSIVFAEQMPRRRMAEVSFSPEQSPLMARKKSKPRIELFTWRLFIKRTGQLLDIAMGNLMVRGIKREERSSSDRERLFEFWGTASTGIKWQDVCWQDMGSSAV